MWRTYLLAVPVLSGCARGDDDARPDGGASRCDATIDVPAGFCATVFADRIGRARHVTVTPSGDVFVAIADSRDGLSAGEVVALRDTDGDGAADERRRFGDAGGTGIVWRDGWLYLGQDDRVVRWPLPDGALEPAGPAEVIVAGLPVEGDHPAKAIQLAHDGALLVSIGSASNSCQEENRAAGSPGIDPCPELDTRAGVWAFDATAVGQVQTDGTRFSTGVRNPTAFTVHPENGAVFTISNGRDQLHEHWPSLYTAEDDVLLPSEELSRLLPDVDRGWPYCYHDPRGDQMKLAPEYGGDGATQGRCAGIDPPLLGLPAHWAPLGLAFYVADAFPAAYHGGMFVAFHGSRFDPLAEGGVPGYAVAFIGFDEHRATGWTPFATGFAGDGRPLPDAAAHRPVGVAVTPDGALLISDDHGGRVWRVEVERR